MVRRQRVKSTLKSLFSRKLFPLTLSISLFIVVFVCLIPLLTQPQKIVEHHSIYATNQRNTEEKAVFELNVGDKYNIMKEHNNWYKVRTQNNQVGWIPVWAANQSNIKSSKDISALTYTDMPIYNTTSKDQKEIDRTGDKEQIPIQMIDEQWAKISYNGQEGYIDTSLIDIVPSGNNTTSTSTTYNEFEAENAEFGKIEHQEGEIVQVRESEQFFFEGPSVDTDIQYVVDLNQTFKYINSVEDDFGEELYYVEDENGQKGYVNSRATAFLADSDNHEPAIATSLKDAVIIIDPGHGGEDPGAIARDDTYEKDLTLLTSLALKESLEKKGAVVMMTRTDDQSVELKDRAKLSNEEHSDIFVSIHYDELAHDFSGTSTYFYHMDDLNLAEAINNALMEGPLQNNGVHFGNYQVIRENNRPSLLLELGYVSSSHDLDIIKTAEYQKQLAHLITQGIENYLTSHAEQ